MYVCVNIIIYLEMPKALFHLFIFGFLVSFSNFCHSLSIVSAMPVS